MKTILVSVDFSDVTQKIIDQVIKIAKPLNANIRLIHITNPAKDSIDIQAGVHIPLMDGMNEGYMTPIKYDIIRDQIASHLKSQRAQLFELRKQLMENNIDTVSLLIEGDIVQTIIDEAKEINADLIILGSHGHGALHKAFVGSITNGVLKKKLSCPVLIVPAS